MVDIDCFKAYNDHLGHQAGDHCLRAVAAALADRLRRPGDLVARFGGEEFVVLLPALAPRAAAEMAEALRSRVEELDVAHPASPVAPRVTISVGAAAVQPAAGGSPADLVRAADQALYRAKAGGRNRVVAAERDQPGRLSQLPSSA